MSVQGSYTHEFVAWTYRLLGFLVGQPVPIEEQNCTTLPFNWFMGFNGTGQCHYTTQNFSQAYSPAFLLKGFYFCCLPGGVKMIPPHLVSSHQITTGRRVIIPHGRSPLGVNWTLGFSWNRPRPKRLKHWQSDSLWWYCRSCWCSWSTASRTFSLAIVYHRKTRKCLILTLAWFVYRVVEEEAKAREFNVFLFWKNWIVRFVVAASEFWKIFSLWHNDFTQNFIN